MSNIVRLKCLFVLLPVVAVAATFCQLEVMREEQTPPLLPGPITHALDRRIAKKGRVTDAFLDGHITLFEAAALFRRAHEEDPVPVSDNGFPGDSSEERLCFQVIEWARLRWLRRSSDQQGEDMVAHDQEARAIAARIEQEVRCHKQRYGKVILPDVGSVSGAEKLLACERDRGSRKEAGESRPSP